MGLVLLDADGEEAAHRPLSGIAHQAVLVFQKIADERQGLDGSESREGEDCGTANEGVVVLQEQDERCDRPRIANLGQRLDRRHPDRPRTSDELPKQGLRTLPATSAPDGSNGGQPNIGLFVLEEFEE